mmetsp:Transcript_18334/g.25495  ORF Transcript_18334/g.25495 Transcript_18334/m.25495 type:complete len:106 (+) Transcript_18334:202-519(+)
MQNNELLAILIYCCLMCYRLSTIATPLADVQLSDKLYKLISYLNKFSQIIKGANESLKTLEKGNALLVILAADTEPIELISHLPILCEDKVYYIFRANPLCFCHI